MTVDDALALFDHDGEPTAHARPTDPHTSHEAARSVGGDRLRASQQAVLAVLKHHGPSTDLLLVELYDMLAAAGAQPVQSPSGIRSRRHELVEAGQVVDTGRRVKLPSGRRAIVWAAA